MLRQYELVEKVLDYDPHADEGMLNRAYVYTVQKHGSQKRASGDPYFSHPVEVAGLMTDLKLDMATIITALLHDTVEDSPKGKRAALRQKMKRLFGPKVLAGVDAMTHHKTKGLSEDEELAEYLDYVESKVGNNKAAVPVKIIDNYVNMKDRVTQFVAGGKDAENARKKLHQYASSIVLLTEKK